MISDRATAGCETRETAGGETATCAAPSCWSDAGTVLVDGVEAVLCETHRKAFLGVST